MISILDELTEIPFQIFIDKWVEKKPCIYNLERAQKTWFYMNEKNRILAFEALCNCHPALLRNIKEPYLFLNRF